MTSYDRKALIGHPVTLQINGDDHLCLLAHLSYAYRWMTYLQPERSNIRLTALMEKLGFWMENDVWVMDFDRCPGCVAADEKEYMHRLAGWGTGHNGTGNCVDHDS